MKTAGDNDTVEANACSKGKKMPQSPESQTATRKLPCSHQARTPGLPQTAQLSREQIQILLQMIAPELAGDQTQVRDSQERAILSEISSRISCYFHYDSPSEMPSRLIETFLGRLEQGLETGNNGWAHDRNQPQAMKDVLERAFDWGLVSGIMKRPEGSVLH